jgi:hypothetical protein
MSDKLVHDRVGLFGKGRIDLLASLESLVVDTWPTPEHNAFAGCNP